MLALPIIPGLRRLKQEDHEFESSLSYRVRPCLNIKQKAVELEGAGPLCTVIVGRADVQ